jgi:uncharacterized protein (DUF1015 family)
VVGRRRPRGNAAYGLGLIGALVYYIQQANRFWSVVLGILKALPPIVVFDTEDGLLVADGYHRLAAARLRGKDMIEAEIRHGSRHDALRYAATVGAVQHDITADEAMEYIRRRSPEQWQGRQ